METTRKPNTPKRSNMYSKDGKYIRSFKSVRELAEHLWMPESTLRTWFKKKETVIDEFGFKYSLDKSSQDIEGLKKMFPIQYTMEEKYFLRLGNTKMPVIELSIMSIHGKIMFVCGRLMTDYVLRLPKSNHTIVNIPNGVSLGCWEVNVDDLTRKDWSTCEGINFITVMKTCSNLFIDTLYRLTSPENRPLLWDSIQRAMIRKTQEHMKKMEEIRTPLVNFNILNLSVNGNDIMTDITYDSDNEVFDAELIPKGSVTDHKMLQVHFPLTVKQTFSFINILNSTDFKHKLLDNITYTLNKWNGDI